MKLREYYRKQLKNPVIFRKVWVYKIKHPKLHSLFKPLTVVYALILTFFEKLKSKKRSKTLYPESKATKQFTLDDVKKCFEQCDVVSFDIFDTLIFRNVEQPVDVFALVETKTKIADFKFSRTFAEIDARAVAEKIHPECEVNIFEIYKELRLFDQKTKDELLEIEFETEKEVCKANPFMMEIFNLAKAQNKKVIIVSDMYWPKDRLIDLLHGCGYDGFDDVFVSCEYRASKLTKRLQKIVSEKYKDQKILHIGDNYASDYYASKSVKNWSSLHYKNVQEEGYFYRVQSESLTSSIAHSLINEKFHTSRNDISKPYEFGYSCGGYLSYGYCQFLDSLIQEQNKKDSILLFTARDSETFYNIYKKHFNSMESCYFYCSRESVLKAAFPYGIHIFFDQMFKNKVGLKIKVADVLKKIDLSFLTKYFSENNLGIDDVLDLVSITKIETIIKEHEDEIAEKYKPIRLACHEYIKQVCKNKKHIVVIDLGWRGTVFSVLKYLISQVLPEAEVIGSEIGSTAGSSIPVTLIENKQLFPYVFSHNENSDLQIPVKYVMIAELLYSSEDASTKGYEIKNGEAVQVFGTKENKKTNIFQEFKQGMYDFASDYDEAYKKLGIELKIGGRESYLPLQKIYQQYDFIVSIYQDLNAKDMIGAEAENAKDMLKRFGYTRKTAAIKY